MTVMHCGGALLLAALLCVSAGAQEAGGGTETVTETVTEKPTQRKGETQGKSEHPINLPNEGEAGQEKAVEESPGKFFINKARSTTTWTFISSFTSIVPYTCYTTGDGDIMPCTGRRLRRSRKLTSDWDLNVDSTRLYGTNADEEEDPLDVADDEAKEGKFFFRVWSTVSTTATLTTFSTNRSVTISVSILCTFAGITYNTC